MPEAVIGTHNELDEDGNVVMQKSKSINKGVKEQQMMWTGNCTTRSTTRIETLETANADLVARVTALEG